MCDDTYVRTIKKKNPIVQEDDRLRILNALKCVDKAYKVDIKTTDDKLLAWNQFKFNVLFSGDDWKNTDRYKRTEEQFKKIGVSIEYLPYTKGVSTTEIKMKIEELKKS